jgi:hypothetical protein
MKSTKYALLVTIGLAVQGLVWGQTITYNGTIPGTFSILDGSNAALNLSDSTAFVAAVGTGTMSESTQSVRLRSNAGYKLSAQVTTNTGIAAGTVAAAAGSTGNAITLADIGFGVSTVAVTGASVVNGGGTPTRTDTTATGFAYTTPTPVDGRISWSTSTLGGILSSSTQILSGDRISASGDNGSDDNFLTVALKAGYLPEYFTPGNFTVVVTLTLAASGT